MFCSSLANKTVQLGWQGLRMPSSGMSENMHTHLWLKKCKKKKNCSPKEILVNLGKTTVELFNSDNNVSWFSVIWKLAHFIKWYQIPQGKVIKSHLLYNTFKTVSLYRNGFIGQLGSARNLPQHQRSLVLFWDIGMHALYPNSRSAHTPTHTNTYTDVIKLISMVQDVINLMGAV